MFTPPMISHKMSGPGFQSMRISEIEKNKHVYKKSRGNDGSTVISEITTGVNGSVQDNIRTIQQIISAIYSINDVQ